MGETADRLLDRLRREDRIQQLVVLLRSATGSDRTDYLEELDQLREAQREQN